ARGMIVDGTAVQQLPRLAVGIDRPVADNPGVEKVKALLARPVDLPVRLADEHRLTLMDGDLRWANVNLECHGVRPHGCTRGAGAAELTWRVGHRSGEHRKLRRVLARILEERTILFVSRTDRPPRRGVVDICAGIRGEKPLRALVESAIARFTRLVQAARAKKRLTSAADELIKTLAPTNRAKDPEIQRNAAGCSRVLACRRRIFG